MKYLLVFLAALAGYPLEAKDMPVDEIVEIQKLSEAALRQDRGYILLRSSSSSIGPVFMRVPTEKEMAEYEVAKKVEFEKKLPALIRKRDGKLKSDATAIIPMPTLESYNFSYEKIFNLNGIDMGKEFEKSDEYNIFLLEVVPGDYVVYGVGFKGLNMSTCLCLGSVQFPVGGGEIIDAGQFLLGMGSGTSRSFEPELAAETGFGFGMAGHNAMFAAALRPANSNMVIPSALRGYKILQAEFSPVGKFVSTSSFNITRLAAIPGVLTYDDGKVIDVPSGQEVPNNY